MKGITLLLAITLMTSIGFAEETVMTRKTHREAFNIVSILTKYEVVKCVKKMLDGDSGPLRVDGEEFSKWIDFIPQEITESASGDFGKKKIVISGLIIEGNDIKKGKGTLEIEVGPFAQTKCTSQATMH